MTRKLNHTAEQIKLYFFVVFLVELFLFSISLAGGRFLGYKTALLVGVGIGVVIAVCFVMIILSNVALIGIQKVIERMIKKERT
jgi:ABC-type transport system involved in multi-copper enzyme maturation permease subunit